MMPESYTHGMMEEKLFNDTFVDLLKKKQTNEVTLNESAAAKLLKQLKE
jgi:hypothetical protein